MTVATFSCTRLLGVAFIILVANAACSSSSGDLSMELKALIPPGAIDISEYQNPPGEYRISFRKLVDYPNVAVSAEAVRLLETRGWKKCYGTTKDWQSYIEVKNGVTLMKYVKHDAYARDRSLIRFSSDCAQ